MRSPRRLAQDSTQYKPYTHIGMHLADFQRNLQYDIKDYLSVRHRNTQESLHTNTRLSVADKNGKVGCSYLAQGSKQLQTKLYIEDKFPEVKL